MPRRLRALLALATAATAVVAAAPAVAADARTRGYTFAVHPRRQLALLV